jgi:hypothetical protein
VRGIARSCAVARHRRGQAARPALQDEGLFTGHAPDGRQKPHWLAAHGTEEVASQMFMVTASRRGAVIHVHVDPVVVDWGEW